METRVKLRILADAAKYDASCASSGGKREGSKTGTGSVTGEGICHSYTPDGRCVSLLKVLLTNFCIYDCRFCVNRLSSDIPRARFETQELVQLFLDFYKRNYVEGLFLSSGILKSVDDTMEALIAVAKSLRREHDFQGYIHLKIVPGASTALVEEAGRYADRLSANVELPSDADLRALAPEKCLSVIHDTMNEVHALAEESRAEPRAPRFAPAGQSTQMVVGATPTPDRDILDTASDLYRRHGLRRIYYSAFSPIPAADKRLPSRAPPLVREHRLYEADWLIRHYGFEARELTSASEPNLDLDRDPKLAWALRERSRFPVDLNRAERAQLLRVPGLGVRNVERLLRLRRHKRVTLDDLKKLRVPLQRTKPFVVTADHLPRDLDDLALPARLERPALPGGTRLAMAAKQLSLFGAVTGQL
jgi:putative DNA modification/repair radical SAM protein